MSFETKLPLLYYEKALVDYLDETNENNKQL